jgi:hypothetical protein
MAEILESGHVYFFYRPRVQRERASGLEDVQRTYMVLRPQEKRVWRLIVIPRKRLPELGSHEREWAFVDTVGRSPETVEDAQDRQRYETKTRGARIRPDARPAGEGIYVLVRHGDHTHLAYELEFPKRPGEVQRELRIRKKASYIVAVKNPEAPSPTGVGLPPPRRPALPKRLEQKFRGRRFAEAEPELLDREGTELVLIGATEDPERELGIELRRREERETQAAIFRDLRLERDEHPLEPLFRGEWR